MQFLWVAYEYILNPCDMCLLWRLKNCFDCQEKCLDCGLFFYFVADSWCQAKFGWNAYILGWEIVLYMSALWQLDN